jgi:RNA polymerase sigma factor (sigma-70 family)
MKPVTTATASARTPLPTAEDDGWHARAGRLFAEFERPAKAMVVRAFRGAFCADELDDIYANAWVGTLRALAGRHSQLADEEIRSYLLTAVANQASRELRRRRRKPTAPLELVGGVPDRAEGPEEQAASQEQSRIARDVLTSLPPRRRAVMLLRYGWGLEPSQVCSLISGLSPRAYRKEITRGVDELTERMRAVESGSWCADREPILKSFVAGLAGEDEARQARAHLAHCRPCSDFVARLGGHLHDLGGSVAAIGTIDGLDGHLGVGDRIADLGDRAGAFLARGGSGASDEATGQLAAAGGARGAGAAGAGVLTKLATLGAAGKVALACVGGGIAATACVAAGVDPFGQGSADDRRPAHERQDGSRARNASAPQLTTEPVPSQVVSESVRPPTAPAVGAGDTGEVSTDAAPAPEPEPETTTPTVATTAPPQEQEFGVAAAATAPPTRSAPAGGGDAGTAGAPTETQSVHQEFGP